MLSAFIGSISGFFDKRFLFNVWFPTFLFSAAGVVVAAIAMGPQAAAEAWSDVPAIIQAWLSVGGLVLVTFLAYICDNLLDTMVRLYEGYWPEWAQGLRRAGIGVQQRRWQHLNERMDLAATREQNMALAIAKVERELTPEQTTPPDQDGVRLQVSQFQQELGKIARLKADRRPRKLIQLSPQLELVRKDILKLRQGKLSKQDKTQWESVEANLKAAFIEQCDQERTRAKVEYDRLYEILYQGYPQVSRRLMPTRLGNVLRAAEEYGKITYNLDAAIVWPRLVQQLPAEFQTRVEQSATPLVTMLFTATLSLLFAFIGGIALFFLSDQWWLFLSIVLGGLLLSAWCYESAIQRSVEYGTLLRTAFDLYRHELLKALSVPLPASHVEEWPLWGQLMQWWYFHKRPFEEGTQPGAGAGKPAWYYEGRKPVVPGEPEPDQHVIYLKLGAPPKEKKEDKK
jgi:hypothetical protein